jgi:hypothetical protein
LARWAIATGEDEWQWTVTDEPPLALLPPLPPHHPRNTPLTKHRSKRPTWFYTLTSVRPETGELVTRRCYEFCLRPKEER